MSIKFLVLEPWAIYSFTGAPPINTHTSYAFGPLYLSSPKTQKAKGLKILESALGSNRSFLLQQNKPLTEEDYKYIWENKVSLRFLQVFARPCPEKPRHGFVDSIEIQSEAELADIIERTLKLDPKAEFLFSERIKATQSAVVTADKLVLGKGTDGATGGKKGCITLPHLGFELSSYALKDAWIKNSPYIESVFSHGKPILVQLRDRLDQPMIGDRIITKEVTVEKILTITPANTDLLTWETAIKAAGKNTVVWLPGGNPLSHYTQHALMSNLPILFTKDKPKIGETLKPNSRNFKKELDEFRTGLECIKPFATIKPEHLTTAIWAVHNASALLTSKEGAKLLGIASMLIFRASTAAILGELRHANRPNDTVSRAKVYKKVLEEEGFFWKLRRRLFIAPHLFLQREVWSYANGFGGMKWGVCAAITADVYKTIIKFVRNPSLNESLVADLIGSLHNLINSVHNGGPLLNKFGLHQDDLDGIASGNLLIFHKAIYGIRDLLKLKPNTQHAEALAKAKQIKISRKAYGLPIDAYMKARTEPRYGVDNYDVYWFDDKYPPPVGTVGFNPSQHHAYTIIRGLRDD